MHVRILKIYSLYSPPISEWRYSLRTSDIRYIVTSTTQPYAMNAQHHSILASLQEGTSALHTAQNTTGEGNSAADCP